jgi:hypothetical protein
VTLPQKIIKQEKWFDSWSHCQRVGGLDLNSRFHRNPKSFIYRSHPGTLKM